MTPAPQSGSDLWLSAVVELRPPGTAPTDPQEAGDPVAAPAVQVEGFILDVEAGQGGAAPAPLPPTAAAMAKAKAFFTSAGFEVHAPVGSTFSIGGRRALFEKFFTTRLVVNEEELGSNVLTEGGGHELTLDVLPDDVRALVKTVSFPPPPQFPTLPS